MELSDQQTAAVMSGMEKKPWWEPRELPSPVLSTDLPAWLLDAHVDMNERASNAPDVKFKIDGRIGPWPVGEPVLYEDEGGGAWTARSSDGYVMRRHYHSGKVSTYVAWRVMNGDEIVTKAHPGGWQIATPSKGETQKVAAEREGAAHLELCKRLKTKGQEPELYTVEYCALLATEKQNGYGGAHFNVTLKDGRPLVLRGPWHGGSPLGWQEVVTWDVNYEWNRRPQMFKGRPIKWYDRGGTFGHYFANDLVLMAVARFMPHVGVAMVYPGYGHARYEFYDQAWGAPKRFAEERKPGWGPKQ